MKRQPKTVSCSSTTTETVKQLATEPLLVPAKSTLAKVAPATKPSMNSFAPTTMAPTK